MFFRPQAKQHTTHEKDLQTKALTLGKYTKDFQNIKKNNSLRER